MSDSIQWTRKDLLGLEDLTPQEITLVLDTAESFTEIAHRPVKKVPALRGMTVVNFFFEPSTRTRTSFELAAKRLSADIVNFISSGSSLSKGESLIDTARAVEAMTIDFVVVRHGASGAPHLLARHIKAHIINAGDGSHEHPTQGLLDLFTIRQKKGRLAGLTVAIVGDITHSRVARSNIWGLKKMGARVIVCGPPTLIPPQIRSLGVDEVTTSLRHAVEEADVINLLRIQHERQEAGLFPSVREYSELFGLTPKAMGWAKKDVLIIHPGPMHRGVEIDPLVADGPHSVVLAQVANGVAVRMAVLYLLAGAPKELSEKEESA